MDHAILIDRVGATCAMLEGTERGSAERVVELCRQLQLRPRGSGRLEPSSNDIAIKRELGRLMETLGRRASRALPAAALARAALADLAGDSASLRSALAECDAKLALFGW